VENSRSKIENAISANWRVDIFVDNPSRIPRENAGIRTVSISRRKNSRDLFSAGGKKPSNLWLCHRELQSFIWKNSLHGKNDFAEGSKILLDTNLKIILLDCQNNFVGILKITAMLQTILIF